MPSAAHPILERLESTIGRYRDTIARLTPELAHLREEKEIVMQFMSEMGSSLKTLIDLRHAADQKAEAEGKRADTAEADAADLRKQIAADEASLKAMLDEVNTETAAETSSDATVSTSPTGATVTVDPTVGTTTHVDPATSVTTTVPHDGSAPTAVDTSTTPAQPVSVPPAAVAEAVAASADAGVTVAAAAAVEAAAQPAI